MNIDLLYDKDNVAAYEYLKQLEILCTESNELYKYFDSFLKMLDSDKTYVRVRGFRLICSLAKYDKDNQINKNIDKILNCIDDVPTNVRQYIKALYQVLLYKIELTDTIIYYLSKFDYSKYKESMSSLIKRDIDEMLKNFA